MSQPCYLSKARRFACIPNGHNLRRLPHGHKLGSLPHDHELRRLIPSVGWSFGACDAAETSPSRANSARSWGSQKHVRCRRGSSATRRIGRWRQSHRCPSPGCPSPRCLSPRCPSPWCSSPLGAPGWLGRRGVTEYSRCRGGVRLG